MELPWAPVAPMTVRIGAIMLMLVLMIELSD
jgi:hypothetical protein